MRCNDNKQCSKLKVQKKNTKQDSRADMELYKLEVESGAKEDL